MKILSTTGDPEIAVVYVAQFTDGELIEFVESIQPPLPRSEKWVLMVSTLFGCPVGCKMCDAGGYYHGKLTKGQIHQQLDYLVKLRYPAGIVPSDQFKIQFARMGEPSFNSAVLEVLKDLPKRYTAPGLMPSISTIAPNGVDEFFEELITIKDTHYANGHFQFQFSIHTTNQELRDKLLPVKKWGFSKISSYGNRFFKPGDRKITLNFALAKDSELDPNILLNYFDPSKYLIKITPLNPTYSANSNAMTSFVNPQNGNYNSEIVAELEKAGYQVIISVGAIEENLIGSNCGQYVLRHLNAEEKLKDGYTYLPFPG